MYGGTAEGVDLILHNHHGLWAFVFERDAEYKEIRLEARSAEGGDSASFAFHARHTRPAASEQETAQYVVEQWRKISNLLGLAAP
jgi:hypothetical protein